MCFLPPQVTRTGDNSFVDWHPISSSSYSSNHSLYCGAASRCASVHEKAGVVSQARRQNPRTQMARLNTRSIGSGWLRCGVHWYFLWRLQHTSRVLWASARLARGSRIAIQFLQWPRRDQWVSIPTRTRYSNWVLHISCPDALFYDVYTHLAELHLADVGIDVCWKDVIVVDNKNLDRWGKTREYFLLPLYRLPIGRMSNFV